MIFSSSCRSCYVFLYTMIYTSNDRWIFSDDIDYRRIDIYGEDSIHRFDISKQCQRALFDKLQDIDFTIFATIQFNYQWDITTKRFEDAFNFANKVKNSILNDFAGGTKYFLRCAYSELLHFHILLKTNKDFNLKKRSTNKLKCLPFKNIKSISRFEYYQRRKNSDLWGRLKLDYKFPAAKIHLVQCLDAQERLKGYTVYNKNYHYQYRNFDYKKFLNGDSNFLYTTNIF